MPNGQFNASWGATSTAANALSMQYTFQGTSGTAAGLYGTVSYTGSADSTASVIGLKGYGQQNAAHTVSNVYGVWGQVGTGAAGDFITNAYSVYATNTYGGSGAVTNGYGVYITSQSLATNHWGIYQAGATDTDYFAGYVQHDQIVQQKVGSAIASASTIAPTTPVVHITGTAAIATVTVPTQCGTSGYSCTVRLIPDGAFTTTTGGNISIASTAVVGRVLELTYDPATAKWYPSY